MDKNNIFQQSVINLFDEKDNSDTWMLSLCDLMSLLLIFVLAWLSITISSNINLKNKYLHTQYLLPNINTLLIPVKNIQGHKPNTVIVLQDSLCFLSNSADLTPKAKKIIRNLSMILNKNKKYDLNIIGHSDKTPVRAGKYTNNLNLSLARAIAVWKEFINNHISPDRIKIQAVGDKYPFESGDNTKNLGENRRVEIVLIPTR